VHGFRFDCHGGVINKSKLNRNTACMHANDKWQNKRRDTIDTCGYPHESKGPQPPIARWEPIISRLGCDVCGEPVKPLEETLTTGGAGSLDVPLTVAERVEAKLVSHLGDTHSVRQILFVGENQNNGLAELVLREHTVELVVCLADTILIVGIHHKNQTLGVLVIVTPERADLILATDVPYSERDVLVLDGFDIESDGRNGRYNLAQLELVEDGRLTGGIQSNLRGKTDRQPVSASDYSRSTSA
jgi:hypothetical protein